MGITNIIPLFVVYNGVMTDKMKEFTEYFSTLVLTHEEEKKKLRQEVFNMKRQNQHLRDKLVRLADKPEISKDELYLIEKIDTLENELRMRDCG